jgi:serine/threonine protein kinase
MLDKSSDRKRYANMARSEWKQTNCLRNYLMSFKPPRFENESLFDKMVDLIERCLKYEPSARIAAADALAHPFVMSGAKISDKSQAVPWPSMPYTIVFSTHKPNSKKKTGPKATRSNSILQDNSPNSKHSTAVSRGSSRVMSSDEEMNNHERPESCARFGKFIRDFMRNVTPKY